jgi:hypothetical protein
MTNEIDEPLREVLKETQALAVRYYEITGKPLDVTGSTFGCGRTAFGGSRLFIAQRRVVIKARVVRHRGRAFPLFRRVLQRRRAAGGLP